jgi:hypothetical protein
VNYAVDTNNIYIGILHFEGSETTWWLHQAM